MDNLFEQMANITKAAAYDIVSKQRDELMDANEEMKKYIDYVREKVSNGSFPYNFEEWKEVGKPDYE